MLAEPVAPARRSAPANRAAIIAAAKRLFLDAGFDGVSMDAIAAEAAVARRTVYNQFKSKEAVFLGVVQAQWAELDAARLVIEHAHEEPAAFLRAAAELSVAFITRADQVRLAQIVITEARRYPWMAEEFYRRGKMPVVAELTRYIAAATARGALACDHPEFAAYQFLGLLHEVLLWPKVMASGAELAAPATAVIMEEAVAMFLSRYAIQR